MSAAEQFQDRVTSEAGPDRGWHGGLERSRKMSGPQGRRVKSGVSDAGVPPSPRRFLYDGFCSKLGTMLECRTCGILWRGP
jgi:hypothetical protein